MLLMWPAMARRRWRRLQRISGCQSRRSSVGLPLPNLRIPGAGTASGDSAEMRDLKKRNRLLEQENEILRRAAAYLARDINPK